MKIKIHPYDNDPRISFVPESEAEELQVAHLYKHAVDFGADAYTFTEHRSVGSDSGFGLRLMLKSTPQ